MNIAEQIQESKDTYIAKTGNGFPDLMYLGRSEMNSLRAYLHAYIDSCTLVAGGGLADKRIEFEGAIVIPCAIASHIGFGHRYND